MMNASWFPYVLPLLIFLARTTDVTLGTIRTISLYRGKKLLSFLLAFVEILIWIMAITFLLKHLANVANIIAYAAGVATGNLLGIVLEEKLITGKLMVRAFIVGEAAPLIQALKGRGFGVTIIDGHGSSGPVKILYIIINRQDYETVVAQIHQLSPKAFYTVEDIRAAREGIFPSLPRSGYFFKLLRG